MKSISHSRQSVEVQPSIPTTLEALDISYKTEPSAISAGMGTKYAVVFRQRGKPKSTERVIPLHQVEAIQQAVEIGRECDGRGESLDDRLFDDRAFAALFGMHDFEYTQVGAAWLDHL